MKRSEIILMLLQIPVDFLLLFLAGISAYQLRFSSFFVQYRPVLFDISLSEFVALMTPVALAWLIIFAFAGLYSIDANRKFSSAVVRIFLACSTGLAAVAVYILFTQQLFDSRFLVAAGWGFAFVYILLGRLLLRAVKALLYRAGIGLRRVAVLGTGPIAETLIDTLNKRKELGYRVVLSADRFTDAFGKEIAKKRVDEVVLTNPRADEKETFRALEWCNRRHVVFKYTADIFSTLSANVAVSPLAGMPIVELRHTRLGAWGRVAKRLFDVLSALVGIIIFSPLLLLLGLAILVETGRPVIYKNERVGIRGNTFFTLKFRSMYQKDSTGSQFGSAGKRAEKEEKKLIAQKNTRMGPIYKIADDPRVTPFGRFLRRWSIDELPQFFNVLAGSMSIVGPRPHQPREVEKYKDEYPHVFTLKPGITGLAQISGRSDLNFEEEMNLDVLYIEKWSLFLDTIIVLKTPFVLFRKRKAE